VTCVTRAMVYAGMSAIVVGVMFIVVSIVVCVVSHFRTRRRKADTDESRGVREAIKSLVVIAVRVQIFLQYYGCLPHAVNCDGAVLLLYITLHKTNHWSMGITLCSRAWVRTCVPVCMSCVSHVTSALCYRTTVFSARKKKDDRDRCYQTKMIVSLHAYTRSCTYACTRT